MFQLALDVVETMDTILKQPIHELETQISHPSGELQWVTKLHLSDLENGALVLAIILENGRQIPLCSTTIAPHEGLVYAYWGVDGFLTLSVTSGRIAFEEDVMPGRSIRLHIAS